MKHERDIERLLDHWFNDGPSRAPDRVLYAVSDRIGRQSQRPSRRLTGRNFGMNTTFKLATAITAVAIVAILGYNLLPGTPAGVGGGTSIEGTWVTTFTKSELTASPLLIDDSEINDGNWGDWTLTFKEGRVSYTQSNILERSASDGSYTTDGNTIVMVFKTGANVGETFGFQWDTSDDVLTFQRDKTVGIAPTPFLVKPWTRSS